MATSTALNLILYGVPFSGTVLVIPPPLLVDAVSTAGLVGDATFTVTITPPTPAPLNYDIQVQVDGGSFMTVAAGTNTLVNVYPNQPEGLYRYRVRANHADGSSQFISSQVINNYVNLSTDLAVTGFHWVVQGGF